MNHPTFPPYAALIRERPPAAFALKFIEPISFSETLKLQFVNGGGVLLDVLSKKTSFPVCDAGLMLAPYVRFGDMPVGLLGRLRRATLSMRADGELLFEKRPLHTFERDADGRVSDEPWFDARTIGKTLFRGVRLDGSYAEASGHLEDTIGVFLPHDSVLQASLYELPTTTETEVEIEIGAIMGHYTTKAEVPK